MIDQTIVVGPFQCNCRLLVCPETNEGVLIDPGDEPEKILERLPENVQIKYLFHTHAHLDHIAGTKKVKSSLDGIPQILLHSGDKELYGNLKMQGDLFGISLEDPAPVDRFFENDEEIEVGKMKFKILHTPGHSPGSVCLRLSENSIIQAPETIFSGDTLFQRSIGRTDLWGGDMDQLLKSIKGRLFVLEDEIRVCPGHGPETELGVEKRQNPFLT